MCVERYMNAWVMYVYHCMCICVHMCVVVCVVECVKYV